MASDFRVQAYLEATKCLKIASGLTHEDPLMWANLFGGIANLMVVSVPNEVVAAVDVYKREQQERRESLLRHLDGVLLR